MLMYEYGSLGPSFTLTRLSLNILIIVIIAAVMRKALKENEVEEIYRLAENAE